MQTDLENEKISAAVLNVRFDDEEKELQARIKVSKGWKAIARKAAAVVMAEQKAKDDALAKLASETEAAKQGAEDSKKAEVSRSALHRPALQTMLSPRSPRARPARRSCRQRLIRRAWSGGEGGRAGKDHRGGGDAAQGGGVGG